MGKKYNTKKAKKDQYSSRDFSRTELKVFKIKKTKDEKLLQKNLIKKELTSGKKIDKHSFSCFNQAASNLSFYKTNIFVYMVRRYI